MTGEEREDGYQLAFDMPGVALDRLEIEAQVGASAAGGNGGPIDAESQGLHETDGLRRAGSPRGLTSA